MMAREAFQHPHNDVRRSNWQQFCGRTTLHCWAYLGEEEDRNSSSSKCQRLFWTAVIAGMLALSGLMLVKTLIEFGEDPVLTTIGQLWSILN